MVFPSGGRGAGGARFAALIISTAEPDRLPALFRGMLGMEAATEQGGREWTGGQ